MIKVPFVEKRRITIKRLTMPFLEKKVLENCGDGDFVNLFSIVWEVERFIVTDDEEKIKSVTFDLIRNLLENKKIRAGYIEERAMFSPIMCTVDKILDKLEKEWKAGDKPVIGGILWFAKI